MTTQQTDQATPARPRFSLGAICATPGALAVLEALPRPASATGTAQLSGAAAAYPLLERHQRGDWGSVDAEDAETNNEAVRSGARILSAYPIDPAKPCKGYGDNCLWIITEADRSSTTILLPEEY